MKTRPFPRAYPHGALEEVFPDVFFVQGTAKMPFLDVRGSRNMVVVRDGRSLTLINTLRLDEQGLAALDALGKVEHTVRLAGFHGMDDPFYKDRYGARAYAVKGQVYAAGFNPKPTADDAYFAADVELDESTPLPTAGRLYRYPSSSVPEGLLVLEREGGIAVAGDSLQNWAVPDRFFNAPGRLMFRLMGFFKPHNVGPGWLKQCRPSREDLLAVLDLPFEHVLPVHGTPVVGGAREKYRPSIVQAAG